MSFDINLPNINAPSDAGKIEQIRGYLYQLADQLKWALNSIESGEKNHLQTAVTANSVVEEEKKAQATFKSIKALIIKSADIVNSYYDEINERLCGQYVAKSDFGEYYNQTTQEIQKTSEGVESHFTNIQDIITNITKGIEELKQSTIEVNAHIKAGLLYYDDNEVPIYGLEVGQKNTIDGVQVFNKYARFTSDRLSFYDQNDTEVAYISDSKLYIDNVEVTGSFQEGGYKDFIDSNGGIVTKWVGR